MAVLTNAGGPGVTAADALEVNGLSLAKLGEPTEARLRALLPTAASLHNPVDMLASASPEQYAACLRLLLGDEAVDGVLVILPPPPMYTAGAVAKALIPVIHNAAKPVVVALMGERLIQEAVEHFRAARVPEYRFPERAASALAVLAQRGQRLESCQDEPLRRADVQVEAARQVLERADSGAFLPSEAVNTLLHAYGIPTLALHLATSAEEAARLADSLGYPVVLKAASPDLPHKSDVGGVLLNLPDAAAVRQGYEEILHRVRAASPAARIKGVHVQKMLQPGQEVICGVVRDAQFGPLLMFGLGGVEVEGLKDVDFALAPLTRCDAEHMLAHTWAGRRLAGYRSLPPGDREAVVDVLVRLGQLAEDFPQIAELEINPLRVMPEGAAALDARGRLASLWDTDEHR